MHAAMHSAPANSLDRSLARAIGGLVDELDRGVAKVLVLSSRIPGVFASEADFRHAPPNAQELADFRDEMCDALEALARSRRPSLAVIDGSALGGGLELAMACTLRCASTTARFALPEVKLGMIPSGGGTQRLPQLVGRGRALELMLSGREIDCNEAARIGLVDRVVIRDALSETLELASVLAHSSAPAMAAIMCCVDASRDLPHDDGIAVERVALASTFEDGEAREGLAALVEERRPAFD